ncbi:uracil-DNA glycosylase [Reinekea sp. G2M2-21]|uniref:uracil-DNA glycosylase n=1 Tax=Reinekea sp. G2M2-21 TaxID=2788942 RepID=UPI0018AC2896|nr:uracil-DNA glycosylase [Reinekea sp. G2M2-21]
MVSILSTLTGTTWHDILQTALTEDSKHDLPAFLQGELDAGKTVYPDQKFWFRALNDVSIDDVNVIILGQDPYHSEGLAQGLSFSVAGSTKLPPSLRNIFKEIQSDTGINNENGDLSVWSVQGVLLLNAVLTVEAGKAGSHAKKGWETLTDAIIAAISERRSGCVFMLWGGYAESKRVLIDELRHLVLTAAHPSPLSAYRGWFGCRHFSAANHFLSEQGKQPIDWATRPVAQISLL